MPTLCVTFGNDNHHWRDCANQCIFYLNTHAGYPCRMLPEAYHSDDKQTQADALGNVRKAIEAAKEKLKVLDEQTALAEVLVAQIEAMKDDVAIKDWRTAL